MVQKRIAALNMARVGKQYSITLVLVFAYLDVSYDKLKLASPHKASSKKLQKKLMVILILLGFSKITCLAAEGRGPLINLAEL